MDGELLIVYKYEITVFESLMAAAHDFGEKQIRVYIPDHGVLGFRKKEKIDFYSDDPKAVEEAREIVSRRLRNLDVRYIGKVVLPDDLASKVISEGRALRLAQERLQSAGKKLINLI